MCFQQKSDNSSCVLRRVALVHRVLQRLCCNCNAVSKCCSNVYIKQPSNQKLAQTTFCYERVQGRARTSCLVFLLCLVLIVLCCVFDVFANDNSGRFVLLVFIGCSNSWRVRKQNQTNQPKRSFVKTQKNKQHKTKQTQQQKRKPSK